MLIKVLEIATYITNLILPFLEKSLRSWVVVLVVIGLLLKKRAKVKGKFIPFAELVAGLLVALLYSFGKGLNGLETFGFIVSQGLTLAATSMTFYSVAKAVLEVAKKGQAKALDVNKEETK